MVAINFYKNLLDAKRLKAMSPIDENRDDIKLEPVIMVSWFQFIYGKFKLTFWETLNQRLIDANFKADKLSANDAELLTRLRIILAWYSYGQAALHGFVNITAAGTIASIPIDTEALDFDDVKSFSSMIFEQANGMFRELTEWLDEIYFNTNDQEPVGEENDAPNESDGVSIGGVWFPGKRKC